MDQNQSYNRLLAEKVISEFEKRNLEGFYAETREDALKMALDMVQKCSVVSHGGSLTLEEIGLKDALFNGDYKYLNPNLGTGAEKEKTAIEAMGADYYFMSTNAISLTGELVNADGIGNRVAALCFGPKNVVIIAGINKIEQSLEAAIMRVKTTAAQKCLFTYKQDFSSFDEMKTAADKVISQFVITSMTNFKGRIKIIIVGEKLGV